MGGVCRNVTQLIGHLEFFRDEDKDCIPRMFILSDFWILKRSDLFLRVIWVKSTLFNFE